MLTIVLVCCITLVATLDGARTPKISKDEVTPEKEESSRATDERVKNESTIKFSANRIVTGLEYLGSGYDVVKANTLGEIDDGEDLGYRAPIIDFYWSRSDVGVTNSLDWLQPVGGWVRPIIACGQSETVTETSDVSHAQDLLQIDIGVSAKLESGKGGHVNVGGGAESRKNANQSKKVHKSTYYCFTYAAGMPPYLTWETTEEFKLETVALPDDPKIFDKCTVQLFKKRAKVCEGAAKWMDFFSLFGTHVTTEVHLGGKITRFLTVPKEATDSFTKAGFNLDAAVEAVISGALVDVKGRLSHEEKKVMEDFSEACDLQFSVLGGIHVSKNITPKSLLKWKATVPKFPMPIKMTVTPMSTFLVGNYTAVYREALNFYVKLSGALPWIIQMYHGVDFNAKTLLESSVQVVATQSQVEKLVVTCPKGKRIMFGVIMEKNDNAKTIHMTKCTQQRQTCESDAKNGAKQGFIWALCGNLMGLNIVQSAKSFGEHDKQKVIRCKKENVLLAGFGVTVTPKNENYIESIKACRSGSSECLVESKSEAHIWTVCLDSRFPMLELVSSEAKFEEKPKSVTLGKELRPVGGFRGCFGIDPQTEVCKGDSNGCVVDVKPKSQCTSVAWGLFLKPS